jgi:serine phosphatase RsbU (regulator of sigma subunit)
MANAGHLPPYLDGIEVPTANGLPLGLIAEAEYAETTVELTGQGRLTLLTDGVVEARNARGELMGFERARELSLERAERIADAAQEFGQEDDITVLSLYPVAAAVPA